MEKGRAKGRVPNVQALLGGQARPGSALPTALEVPPVPPTTWLAQDFDIGAVPMQWLWQPNRKGHVVVTTTGLARPEARWWWAGRGSSAASDFGGRWHVGRRRRRGWAACDVGTGWRDTGSTGVIPGLTPDMPGAVLAMAFRSRQTQGRGVVRHLWAGRSARVRQQRAGTDGGWRARGRPGWFAEGPERKGRRCRNCASSR